MPSLLAKLERTNVQYIQVENINWSTTPGRFIVMYVDAIRTTQVVPADGLQQASRWLLLLMRPQAVIR